MSLINDALKRARQTQQENPFGGLPAVPLQPADNAGHPNYFLRAVVALLTVALLASSGWFFWKWGGHREEQRTVVAAKEPKADPAMQSKMPIQSSPRKSVIKVSTNIVVRTNVTTAPKPGVVAPPEPTNASIAVSQASATAPAPPAVPPSPVADLKLRSIIYREDRPAAVINGDMLYVGDEIRGARVVHIDRYSVTVERKGETNELRLPRL